MASDKVVEVRFGAPGNVLEIRVEPSKWTWPGRWGISVAWQPPSGWV